MSSAPRTPVLLVLLTLLAACAPDEVPTGPATSADAVVPAEESDRDADTAVADEEEEEKPPAPGTLSQALGGGWSDRGWGPVPLGEIVEPTLVEIRVSGIMVLVHNYPPELKGWIGGLLDPGGKFFWGALYNCMGNVGVEFSEAGVYVPCDELNQTPLQGTWTARRVVRGTGETWRRVGPKLGGNNRCNARHLGWPACYWLAGLQTVTVTPVADELQVEADESEVIPGTDVEFRAYTSEDVPFEVRKWIWVANDDEPPIAGEGEDNRAMATECSETEECTTRRIWTEGTMYVRALVNGVIQQADVSVDVVGDPGETDRLIVTADKSTVCRGEEISFTAKTQNGSEFEVLEWRWTPTDGPETEPCSGGKTCTIEVVESGRMTARARIGEKEQEADESVSVEHGDLETTVNVQPKRVIPVLAREFDAIDQSVRDPVQPIWETRWDTARVSVEARWSACDGPPEEARATLTAVPLENSGGHQHGWPGDANHPRPTGTFFEPGEDPNGSSGERGRITVTLSEGTAQVLYRTSGVSGVEQIAVEVNAEEEIAEDRVEVAIMWPGLQAMPRDGTHYYYSDQDPLRRAGMRHGNINHFVQPVMRGSLESLFAAYFEVFSENAERFRISDASLAWGGLHDIRSYPWGNPHRLHRRGLDADVSDRTVPEERWETFQILCQGFGLLCTPEHNRNHWHVSYVSGGNFLSVVLRQLVDREMRE